MTTFFFFANLIEETAVRGRSLNAASMALGSGLGRGMGRMSIPAYLGIWRRWAGFERPGPETWPPAPGRYAALCEHMRRIANAPSIPRDLMA